MNERIRQLRSMLKMSQEEFGKLLGITKSGVSDIESGRRKVTNQHLIMLSRHGVNEDWLRTGNGEMFIEQSRDEDYTDIIQVLTSLDKDDWQLLLHTAFVLADKKVVMKK